jgi:hypothetical protein
MKKAVFLLLMIATILSGCSKDENTSFDFDINLLYGTWRVTHVMQSNGTYFDVTTNVGESVFEPTYAIFNADGSYSGSGEFGTGSGTYTAIGKTITTFVSGKEYLKYDVVSLTGTTAELIMSETGSTSTLKIKVTKQ